MICFAIGCQIGTSGAVASSACWRSVSAAFLEGSRAALLTPARFTVCLSLHRGAQSGFTVNRLASRAKSQRPSEVFVRIVSV